MSFEVLKASVASLVLSLLVSSAEATTQETSEDADNAAVLNEEITFPGAPRVGRAGVTGTYQIVFQNEVVITLEKVEYVRMVGTGGIQPSFRAHYANGETRFIAFDENFRGMGLQRTNIVAIFRISEDVND